MPEAAQVAQPPSADAARATAERAYVFAYPMLEHYRTFGAALLAQGTPLYTGAFNVVNRRRRLAAGARAQAAGGCPAPC